MDVDEAYVQVPIKPDADDKNCFLCRKSTNNHVSIVGGIQPTSSESHRGTIIAKYFTFELQEMTGEVVCLRCWSKVEEFHQFHGEIEVAHAEPIPFVHVHVKQEIGEYVDMNDDEKEHEELESMIEVKEERLTEVEAVPDNENEQPVENEGDSSDPDYEPENEDNEMIPRNKDGETTPKVSPENQKFSRESDALIAQKCDVICHKCSKTFQKFFDLQTHCIEVHNTRGRLTCCNRDYTDRSRLLEHLYSHDNPDLFRCVVCSAAYSCVGNLSRHLVHKHTVYTGTPSHAMTCDKCGKCYTEKLQYRAHMNRHLAKETKQFYCKECDKIFLTNSQLKMHVRERHTLSFDYVCKMCSKGFLSKPKYETHVQAHITKQKTECPECHRWYAKSTIKKHILNCQGMEPKS